MRELYSNDCAFCSAKEGKHCYIEKGSKQCIEQIIEWLQKECEKVANEPKHMGEIIQENIKNLKNIIDNEFKGE